MAEETGKGMNGNEYATAVFQYWSQKRAPEFSIAFVEQLREAFGTGFCAGVAFAKGLPLNDEVENG